MIKIDLREKNLKNIHGNKKIRVNASLDQDTHNKLQKLSISCNMTKTMLAAEILKMAVNHYDIINFYQDRFNVNEQYRVIPIKQGDKIIY